MKLEEFITRLEKDLLHSNAGAKASPQLLSREDSIAANPKLVGMFPMERLRQIKAKELRRYRAAQDEKWQRWLESVSK